VPKILIVTATAGEIQPLAKHFNMEVSGEGLFQNPDASVLILVAGVGMVNTAFYMGKCSGLMFDYMINAGICGAFNRELKIGEVVNIEEDTLSEMGAEDGTAFIKYQQLGLEGTNLYRNHIKTPIKQLNNLRKVKGITVNKVHGSDASIKDAVAFFNADVESMEGAAFFRGCQNLKADYFQLRAVSNYVERRDKSKWNVGMAIENLNHFLVDLVSDLKGR
jgi:futalosine hydrolase